MLKVRIFLLGLAMLFAGIAIGAFLFSDTRPRSFLSLPNCTSSCFTSREILGLFTSVGMRVTAGHVPVAVEETDKAIAFKSPQPLATVDYVVFPKKDIRDIGDLSVEDTTYISDSFQIMASLVRKDALTDYKIITNGPGFQSINYLHFHLLAE